MSHAFIRNSPSGEPIEVDGEIASVFGRVGIVVAELNDYSASLIDNDSGVAGTTVAAALNTLAGAIPAAVGAVGTVQVSDGAGLFAGSPSLLAGAFVRQNGPSVTIGITGGATAVLAHVGAFLDFTGGVASVYTIDTDAVTPMPIGSIIYLTQIGDGALSVAGAGGLVTILTAPDKGLNFSGQGAFAMLRKTSANTWLLTGEVVA